MTVSNVKSYEVGILEPVCKIDVYEVLVVNVLREFFVESFDKMVKLEGRGRENGRERSSRGGGRRKLDV